MKTRGLLKKLIETTGYTIQKVQQEVPVQKVQTDVIQKEQQDIPRAKFQFTRQSLKYLRNEGLPENIVRTLKPLKHQEIHKENEFWEAVEKYIGKEQTVRYQKQILNAVPGIVYDQDDLRTKHNHDFMLEPSFREAYERGVLAAEQDYRWHWRVHIGLWVAFSASKLNGDFVECGVNRGFLSSAIMKYLDWNSLDKHFYLLDTFCGLDERFVSDREIKAGVLEMNKKRLEKGAYVLGVESVRLNFSEWKNAHIIQGTIPETLNIVETKRVAYLHLDLNCSLPEVEAINFFWDRLVPGAFILMDDYGWCESPDQKPAMDAFADKKGLKIASLPTGQGLLIKPA